MVNGRATVPGPFRLISHLPLVDLVVAARLALVVIPFVGILLAIGLDQSVTLARPWLRYLVPAAVALACLPILPLPVPTVSVPAVPHFITAGTWRGYVPGDRTLVPVPTPSSFALDGMRATQKTARWFAPQDKSIDCGLKQEGWIALTAAELANGEWSWKFLQMLLHPRRQPTFIEAVLRLDFSKPSGVNHGRHFAAASRLIFFARDQR